ncbi:MAG TPA: SDR family NAD(P)-dependent oxidoreductase, partial [Clostridia bacterium]|nr:SDR family NAD(P)-dependent oxidoreductase [Clostridia bacterium]
VDALLEVSVVGSFSRTGSAIRRRLDAWTAPPAGALAGRTVVLTGPTSGLGRAMADRLAGLGARLVLLGRDPDRLAAVRDELAGAYGTAAAEAVVTDMASLESVRAAVDTILEREPRIDVVIDNAGAIFAERETTDAGLEATLATMVVGPFALVSGLLPRLRTTPGARVIAVTSGGMYAQPLELDDLGWERRSWNGTRAYGQAKRAQVALIREWARRLPSSEVAFAAMHPGWAATPGLAAALPGFARLMGPLLRSADEGIDTAVWLAALPAPAVASGRLFLDRRPRPFDRVPWTRVPSAARRRLWDTAAQLAGIPDPAPDSGPIGAADPRHLAHGAHR